LFAKHACRLFVVHALACWSLSAACFCQPNVTGCATAVHICFEDPGW